jgi:glycosyltransferase involved in cell wall biosynthesis
VRVLHTEWSDGWGGQEIRIISEMEGVREKGVDVRLACREKSRIKEEALKRGFKVYTLPFRGNLDFKTLFELIKIVKRDNIDIINTHSGKDTWVGGLAAKLSGRKFIRTRHLSNRINPSRTNFINELADFIITTGESVREDMIKYNRINPNKIISIPTGIDDELFDPLKYDKQKSREIFGLNKDKYYIGILAVLRSFKRHDFFLDIANYFKDNENIEFVIAGEGPKREEIENKIKALNLKNVKLLGHVTKVPEFLKAIDLQLLTSDSKEGVPQSVIQGLMMQKDIIASNVGSVKDLYKDNNFLMLDGLDLNKWVEGVERIYNKELKLNKDRDYIVENFSKKAMVKKVLDVYKRVLN